MTTVFLELFFSNTSIIFIGKRTFSSEKLDKNKLRNHFQDQNWEDVLEARSIDESTRMFTNVFMDSAQEYIRVKTV